MKHFVFIVGSYYPFFSATGTCCLNIAAEIAKDNKVTVVCMRSDMHQPEYENYRGQNIIRVSNRWWDIRLIITGKINESRGLVKKWYSMLLTAIRAKNYFQIIMAKRSLNEGFIRSYLRALKNIDDSIDVIVPLCDPIEAVVAGMKYKNEHNKVKLIPYLFDPFVESHTLHRTEWNKRLKKGSNRKIEAEMMAIATKVFCVNHLHEHFLKYEGSHNKLIVTEHPLLTEVNGDRTKVEVPQGKLHFVYTGVFDKKIRNPEYLLKFVLHALPMINGELHLYSDGNCTGILDDYARNSDGCIIYHGRVPKQEANDAIVSSDILISVGNMDNLQTPSKIFEYISTGKPIVHFYTVDNDNIISILKNYSLCLCLKQDEGLLEENVGKFVKFCLDNKDNSLDFSAVENLYYYASPRFIVNKFWEYVSG